MTEGERRLAAIMFTDMVGYTVLGQRNESLSLALVEEQRELVRPILTRHNGREVKTMGDAFLVEFASALEAVACATDIQSALKKLNFQRSDERRIDLRIGIHLGDIIHSGGDVGGDAVNIASRIEPLAPPGGICVTSQVQASVLGKAGHRFVSLGMPELKNVDVPVEVFQVEGFGETVSGLAAQREYFSKDKIAVLPFANLSPDPNDEYFADGITDEIISASAGISGLRVISRTSITSYKGTKKRIRDIGRELKVGSILEGSVKKAGNRIRVTTQLIDVATDNPLWAQNYDRDVDDVFAVQCDIAKQVAGALKVRIPSPEMERIERRPTEDPTAYTLYLKGRYFWNARVRGNALENIKKAAECFERAVGLDPDFGLGYVGQADCCLVIRDNWNLDVDSNLKTAKIKVSKALQLDPGLAEAHATMGLVLMDEYNLRAAEGEYRKAIELKPSYGTAHQWYYQLLRSQMRWDEAIEQIEKAIEFDPLAPVIRFNHAYIYYLRRDYSRALELFMRAAELGNDPAHGSLAETYGRMKRFEDMKREYAVDVELNLPNFPRARLSADAQIAFLEKDKEALKRLLPELEAHLEEAGQLAYAVATYYLFLGDLDKGFEWLEKSYSNRESNLTVMNADCDLDGVRNDPRYLEFLKRLGLDQIPRSG